MATPPTVPDQALVEAVELILRALARLFVEQGLVFPTVERAARVLLDELERLGVAARSEPDHARRRSRAERLPA